MAILIAPLDALQVSDPEPSYVRKLTQLSTAAGKFSVRANATAPAATRPLTLELTSVEEIDEFWAWYEQVIGAYQGFWVPTFQRDLVPLGPIGPADLTFNIQDRAYTDLELPANRYAIMFMLPNGSMIQRQINAAVRNLDGTETLTLNSALGVTFTQTRNSGICFLLYGRLTEDKVAMEWWSHQQATVQVQMKELPAPLIESTGLDAGVGVWGAYHGPIGGGGAFFFVRYDLSPYVAPNTEYIVRFLVQSLGGQTVDVIGLRVQSEESSGVSMKPGSPWSYQDRGHTTGASGTMWADIGHFAMQIGAAAIVEIAWLAIYDPNDFPSLDDPVGSEVPGYPVPPAIPGNFVALIPLGTYVLHQDEGQTSLDDNCPPTSPDSMVCELLL